MKNNIKHGKGILLSNIGKIEGIWNNDNLTGKWKIEYSNGDVY